MKSRIDGGREMGASSRADEAGSTSNGSFSASSRAMASPGAPSPISSASDAGPRSPCSRRAEGEHLLPAPLVRDDGGPGEQAVAVGVVAVVVGVDERADRPGLTFTIASR